MVSLGRAHTFQRHSCWVHFRSLETQKQLEIRGRTSPDSESLQMLVPGTVSLQPGHHFARASGPLTDAAVTGGPNPTAVQLHAVPVSQLWGHITCACLPLALIKRGLIFHHYLGSSYPNTHIIVISHAGWTQAYAQEHCWEHPPVPIGQHIQRIT